MRFDNHEPPKTILSARDQRVLIALTIALGVVLFAIKVSSKPEFWAKLFPEKFPDANVIAESKDFESAAAPAGLGENEFLSPAEDLSEAASLSNNSRMSMLAKELPERSPAPRSLFPPETLATIRDNTVGVRSSETSAWLNMVAAARDVDPLQLTESAIEPDFRVVMVSPERFRGVAMTIEGELRRVSTIEVEPNRYGVSELYDAWLFTRDSGSNPYHVVASAISEDLPAEGDFADPVPVKLTGFFFKREHYMNSARDLHAAPLVLAQQITAVPQVAVVASATTNMQRYLTWFAFAVAVALGLTLWNFAVSDFAFRASRVRRIYEPAPDTDFEGVEATDLRDVFRQLAEG